MARVAWRGYGMVWYLLVGWLAGVRRERHPENMMKSRRDDENITREQAREVLMLSVIGYRVLAVVAIVVGCLLYTHYPICKDAGSCPLASLPDLRIFV